MHNLPTYVPTSAINDNNMGLLYPCSDHYHSEPYKALQDWTDHLDRMAELNKIFPGDHPAYYEPKKPLPLPERRATSLPPIRGYNFSGNVIRNSHIKY